MAVDSLGAFMSTRAALEPGMANDITQFISSAFSTMQIDAPDGLAAGAEELWSAVPQLALVAQPDAGEVVLASTNLNVTVIAASNPATLTENPIAVSTSQQSPAQVSLPPDVLEGIIGFNASRPVQASLFTTADYRAHKRLSVAVNVTLRASPIVSFSLLQGGTMLDISDRPNPINLSIPFDPPNDPYLRSECRWYDSEAWVSDGCMTSHDSQSAVAICSCNHLTDFAVFEVPKNVTIYLDHLAAEALRIQRLHMMRDCAAAPNSSSVGWGAGLALLIMLATSSVCAVCRDQKYEPTRSGRKKSQVYSMDGDGASAMEAPESTLENPAIECPPVLRAFTKRHTLIAGAFSRGLNGHTRAQTVLIIFNVIALEIVVSSRLALPDAVADVASSTGKSTLLGIASSFFTLPSVFLFTLAFHTDALVWLGYELMWVFFPDHLRKSRFAKWFLVAPQPVDDTILSWIDHSAERQKLKRRFHGKPVPWGAEDRYAVARMAGGSQHSTTSFPEGISIPLTKGKPKGFGKQMKQRAVLGAGAIATDPVEAMWARTPPPSPPEDDSATEQPRDEMTPIVSIGPGVAQNIEPNSGEAVVQEFLDEEGTEGAHPIADDRDPRVAADGENDPLKEADVDDAVELEEQKREEGVEDDDDERTIGEEANDEQDEDGEEGSMEKHTLEEKPTDGSDPEAAQKLSKLFSTKKKVGIQLPTVSATADIPPPDATVPERKPSARQGLVRQLSSQAVEHISVKGRQLSRKLSDKMALSPRSRRTFRRRKKIAQRKYHEALAMVPNYLSRHEKTDEFLSGQYLSSALRDRRIWSTLRIGWGWFLNLLFFYSLLWSIIRDACEMSVYPSGSQQLVAVWANAFIWRLLVLEPLLVVGSFYLPWAISTYVLSPGGFVA